MFKSILRAGVVAMMAAGAACAAPLYHLHQIVKLGAPDHWDYVVADPVTHRVYVAHGDRVSVVDGRSGRILGEVGMFPGGTHGIAVAAAEGRGYTDDGKAGLAEGFDLRTLKSTGPIAAAEDADGIAFDEKSGHVFVVDGDSGKISVIDARSNRNIATIDAGAKLEYAVVDGAGKLYVNGAARNELLRIDIAGNRIDARWPLAGCQSPTGLAVDTVGRRVFSSCRNGVMDVINADSGALVASLPIGRGTDSAAYDPRRHRVFSSNGKDGTITVIDEQTPDRFVVAGTLATKVTGRTMGIDTGTGRLYVAAGDVAGVNAKGHAVIKPGSLQLLMFDPAAD